MRDAHITSRTGPPGVGSRTMTAVMHCVPEGYKPRIVATTDDIFTATRDLHIDRGQWRASND